jgi:hypothetical protein
MPATRLGASEATRCGGYTIKTTRPRIGRVFGVPDGAKVPFRSNVRPTRAVPVVRPAADGGREWVALGWGLLRTRVNTKKAVPGHGGKHAGRSCPTGLPGSARNPAGSGWMYCGAFPSGLSVTTDGKG